MFCSITNWKTLNSEHDKIIGMNGSNLCEKKNSKTYKYRVILVTCCVRLGIFDKRERGVHFHGLMKKLNNNNNRYMCKGQELF